MLFQIKAIIVLLIGIMSLGTVRNGCILPYTFLGNYAVTPNSFSGGNSPCCMPTSELTVGLDSNGNVTFTAEVWQGTNCNAIILNNTLSFSAQLANESLIDGWGSGYCCASPDNCYQFIGLSVSGGGESNDIEWFIDYSDSEGNQGCEIGYHIISQDGKNLRINLIILLVIACILM